MTILFYWYFFGFVAIAITFFSFIFVNFCVVGQHWRVHWGKFYWEFRRDFNQVTCISTILLYANRLWRCFSGTHTRPLNLVFVLLSLCWNWKRKGFCLSTIWYFLYSAICLLVWIEWSQRGWYMIILPKKPLSTFLLLVWLYG